MKKFTVLLCCLMLILTLSGCEKKTKSYTAEEVFTSFRDIITQKDIKRLESISTPQFIGSDTYKNIINSGIYNNYGNLRVALMPEESGKYGIKQELDGSSGPNYQYYVAIYGDDKLIHNKVVLIQKTSSGYAIGSIADLGDADTSDPSKTTAATNEISIAPVAGIGDSLSTFQSAFGSGVNRNGLYNFKDGKVLVMFSGERAFNITVNHDYIPVKDATAELKDYLPSDYKLIKTKEIVDGSYIKLVAYCKSDKLADTFSKEMFVSSEKGGFTIIQKLNSSGKAFASIIGLGHNP
jgi:hypothetical protein